MIEKQVTKVVYISDDGKEFLSEEECKKYEIFVKEVLSHIRYYLVLCNPDLTETGCFQHKIYVAVWSYNFHKEVVIEWAFRKFGNYLGEGVQGYGFSPCFDVVESDKNKYETCAPTEWGGMELKSEKIFLSPKQVDSFPENIDYMKEWGFK